MIPSSGNRESSLRPASPRSTKQLAADALPVVFVVFAAVTSWWGLVAPSLENSAQVVRAREELAQDLEALRLQLSRASDLDLTKDPTTLVALQDMERQIQAHWKVARVSEVLLPKLELRAAGPVLTFVEVSNDPRSRRP